MFNEEAISNLNQGTLMNADGKVVVESLNSVHSCCSKKILFPIFLEMKVREDRSGGRNECYRL